MKLGLDIHGTITSNPNFFLLLTNSIIYAGGQVHIISGPPLSQINKELDTLGFLLKFRIVEGSESKIYGNYTHLFSIVDYHKNRGTPMTQDEKGNWHLDKILWDETKAMYCLEHNIDLMIDNSPIYGEFFKTPYAKYRGNKYAQVSN